MNTVLASAIIADARAATDRWPGWARREVIATCPDFIRADPRVKVSRDWPAAVALHQRDTETPLAAAQRLALYLTLHQERWETTPTLAAVTANAIDRSPTP